MKETKKWSEKKLNDFRKKWQAVTVPVNVELENKQIAIDLTRANKIIMQAEKIALRDCTCRKTLQNCNHPINVCILFNQRAEDFVNIEQAKWIIPDQAKRIVFETHQKGLVHLAMHLSNKKDEFPLEICSCCSCCCQAFQALQLLNSKGLVEPSEYVARFDQETCNECGICVDRCHFGARILDPDKNIVYKSDLCFGCGLCITSCPENSIELIPRQ